MSRGQRKIVKKSHKTHKQAEYTPSVCINAPQNFPQAALSARGDPCPLKQWRFYKRAAAAHPKARRRGIPTVLFLILNQILFAQCRDVGIGDVQLLAAVLHNAAVALLHLLDDRL